MTIGHDGDPRAKRHARFEEHEQWCREMDRRLLESFPEGRQREKMRKIIERPHHLDRMGVPLTLEQWTELFGNHEYKRIGWDELPNGYIISTVWLGLDHSFGMGPPMIFETAVSDGTLHESPWRPGVEVLTFEVVDRYSTEEQAQLGHREWVEKVRAGWKVGDE